MTGNWFSSAFHSYQAELYPTRIRSQAVGFVYSWSRFSSIFIGFLIASVLKLHGSTGVFVIIAIAMLVVAVTIGFFDPKKTASGSKCCRAKRGLASCARSSQAAAHSNGTAFASGTRWETGTVAPL